MTRPTSTRPQWPGVAVGALWLTLASVMTLALWAIPAPSSDPTTVPPQTSTAKAAETPKVTAPIVAAIQLPPPPAPPRSVTTDAPMDPAPTKNPTPAQPARLIKPLQAKPVSPLSAPEIAPLKPQPNPISLPIMKPAKIAVVSQPAPMQRVAVKPLIAQADALPRQEKPTESKKLPLSAPAIDAQAEPIIEPVTETARTGRVLLRMLEHGAGPRIEIAWPDSKARRERLFGLLNGCFGMRVAYLDDEGALFVDDGPRGQSWAPNVDRYSGFLRQPLGPMTDAEERTLRKISNHHAGRLLGNAVRLFSRRADAVLLGGLSHLVGDAYAVAKTVTARYEFADGRLRVTNVRIDGKAMPGAIDLTPLAPTCVKGA